MKNKFGSVTSNDNHYTFHLLLKILIKKVMKGVQDTYHHMEKRSEETSTVFTDDDYKNIPINMKLCLKWSSFALSFLRGTVGANNNRVTEQSIMWCKNTKNRFQLALHTWLWPT